jgi:hypothetical protein
MSFGLKALSCSDTDLVAIGSAGVEGMIGLVGVLDPPPPPHAAATARAIVRRKRIVQLLAVWDRRPVVRIESP